MSEKNKQKIVVRSIINMVGKPKEHLEQIIRNYIEELRKEDGVKVLKEDYAEAKRQNDDGVVDGDDDDTKDSESSKYTDGSKNNIDNNNRINGKGIKDNNNVMFSTFVEVDVEFDDVDKLMWFCFDFMPSSVEIISPDEFVYKAPDFTDFLNEIQSKLHKLDMLIKNFEADNKVLKKNGLTLVKNLIIILLKEKSRNINDISKEAGVPADHILKFVDALIKEGKVKEENGVYSLSN
ncbi:MAG: hypothetical protein ABIG89_04245 [Candidatus Woesearchaeota archaeon]